jgi:hypothetical protein
MVAVLPLLFLGGIALQDTASATPVPTALGLIESVSTSVPGQPVIYTATVSTVPPGGTPTGNVTFTFDAHVVCAGGSNVIALTAGQAVCTTTSVPFTESPLTASAKFPGNTNYGPSGPQTVTQTITPATVSMVVAGANEPMGGTGSGKPNNFVATLTAVSPSTDLAAGTVNWLVTSSDGSVTISCSNGSPSKVNARGQSHCSVPAGQLTAAGAPWNVSAVYGGNDEFATQSTTLAGGQLVHATTTKTYVTASPNPVVRDSEIQISASVVNPSFAGVPTGSLTFAFTGTNASSIVCAGGSNTIELTSAGALCSLPSGFDVPNSVYTVAVTYSGDGNNGVSSSKVLKIKVH